jgi:hypothetical protein
MNIFFLDKTPELSAKMLCDKHVPKMLLESAQMLSTALHSHTMGINTMAFQKQGRWLLKNMVGIYKKAYPNHPMTKWVGFNRDNFNWALENAMWINEEYKTRFKKQHKSGKVIQCIIDNDYYKDIPDGFFSEPPQCMPDEYKDKDYVVAYRRYYVGEKKYFAKWEKGRSQPEWWV